MPDVVFRYVMMANAQPLGMYEVATAGESTVMDNIVAAGDVTTEQLSKIPPAEELTSPTVEAGKFVILYDFPSLARRTRILLEDGAARMAFFANELTALISEPLSREQLYFAHLLGGYISQRDVRNAGAHFRAQGATPEEAALAGVIDDMSALAELAAGVD